MSCKDNKDGSCTVEYIPFTPGDYDVNITFGGRPIPGVHGGAGAGAGEAAGGLPSETETGRKSDVRLVPRAGWPRAPPAGREQSWQARVLWSWSRGRVVGTQCWHPGPLSSITQTQSKPLWLAWQGQPLTPSHSQCQQNKGPTLPSCRAKQLGQGGSQGGHA